MASGWRCWGGFIEGEGQVRLTSLGREALSRGLEEEPNRDVLRLFVSVLVLRYPAAWVAYWQGDPSALEWVLPETEHQVLSRAEMEPRSPGEDLEVWAWWDALGQVPVSEETVAFRKAIGDAGEELSVQHERERLKCEGFPELAEQVRWVGQESPAYGFDVLSFRGRSFRSRPPHQRLAIEVKGLAVVARKRFPFYLTEHEWKTALTLGEHHIFHLWDGVTPKPNLGCPRSEPIVVTASAFINHVPQGPLCKEPCGWKSTMIALPITG